MKKWVMVLGMAGLCFLLQPAVADKLLIMSIDNEPPNSAEGIPRPKPAMSMQKVIEIFGKPRAQSDPVGSPAITRWVYDDFIVVFENDKVVNSVVKKSQFSDLNN